MPVPPRVFLAPNNRRGVRGRCPGRWDCNRENRYLPLPGSGGRNAGRGSGRESLDPGCRGEECPCRQSRQRMSGSWVQGEAKSPGRAATAKRCTQPEYPRTGNQADNPLTSTSQVTREFRGSLGVSTGDGKSPYKVGVVLPRTPCTQTYFQLPITFSFYQASLLPVQFDFPHTNPHIPLSPCLTLNHPALENVELHIICLPNIT